MRLKNDSKIRPAGELGPPMGVKRGTGSPAARALKPPLRAVGYMLVGLMVFTGCGCSNIDRQWDAAPDHPNGIEGRWQGVWKSQQDGHAGALRCVIRQSGPELYDCLFNATYGGVFRFTYEARLSGRRVGEQVYLSGDQDLGWPVGSYHYAGSATPFEFFCAYHARDDHGYFAMARPGGTPPAAPLRPPATRP